MNSKGITILVLVSGVLGYSLGEKYSAPKTETKIVTVEKDVQKSNIITKTKEQKRPDGTVETTTVVIDKSIKEVQTTNTLEHTIDKKSRYLRVHYAVLGSPSYDIGYGQRVFGSTYLDVGISANPELNNKQLKLGILVEF